MGRMISDQDSCVSVCVCAPTNMQVQSPMRVIEKARGHLQAPSDIVLHLSFLRQSFPLNFPLW